MMLSAARNLSPELPTMPLFIAPKSNAIVGIPPVLPAAFPIMLLAVPGGPISLRIMEKVGLVHSIRRGRESLWQLDQRRLEDVRRHLEQISRQWDQALARLKSVVERQID
jgi:hypothetical protein